MTAIKHQASSTGASNERTLRSSSKSIPDAALAGKVEAGELVVTQVDAKGEEADVSNRVVNASVKKRHFEESAEDKKLEPITPPKKSKTNVDHSSLIQGYKSDSASDSDTMSQSGSPPSLSLSPLKLVAHTDGRGENKEMEHKGKQKAAEQFLATQLEGVDHDALFAPISLSQDDDTGMDLAVADSKRLSDVHFGDKSASTSSIPKAESLAVPGAASPAVGTRPRRTFKDMVPETHIEPFMAPVMSSGPLLQDDLMRFKVSSLPLQCEVNDEELYDPLLADSYDQLPKLRSGLFESWSKTWDALEMEHHLVAFIGWRKQSPSMDYDLAHSAITFTRHMHYINPSRASPLEVNIQYSSHNSKSSMLYCNYKVAICLSSLLSNESHLLTPAMFGLRNKYISGYFHQQEWQRFRAFACMVFDKTSMVAQIFDNCLSFTTTGSLREEREGNSSQPFIPQNPDIFSTAVSSHHRRAREKGTGNFFKSHLKYTDDVPIYGAREHPFNFETDLDDIAAILPRYHKEVPPASFVIVGYTMGHSEKGKKAFLSTNIQFVIIVGTQSGIQ